MRKINLFFCRLCTYQCRYVFGKIMSFGIVKHFGLVYLIQVPYGNRTDIFLLSEV